MSEPPRPLSEENMTFKDLEVGRYFVSVRDPQLGPLLKCNANEAVDDSDRHMRIASDEQVVV